MGRTIRLQRHAQRLLDHCDLDIVDRYLEYLLERPERHLWIGKVLIDVDQVVRMKFACDTHLCLKHSKNPEKPHRFKSRHSCCVDLEVQLLPTEVEMIERHLPAVMAGHADVAKHVRRHGFWTHDREWSKIIQKKRDGSCAFLTYHPGLRQQVCSLHATALRDGIPLPAIKPLICRMFPVFLLESSEGQHIITCYSEKTHPLLFEEEYTRMNCLHANDRATEPVFRALRNGLTALLGEEGYGLLCREAERILAGGNGRPAGRRA